MAHEVKKVAFLTAGGLAPCLSSSIGCLIREYTRKAPHVELIAYRNGYMGLLKGESIVITPTIRAKAYLLPENGGSAIGNSRVKLTNVADCVKRGLVREGQDPLHVAAEQLVKDGVDVLHTIGGDDTNTTAADLAKYLAQNNYALTVVGLPKTIDNDVYPIHQSLGAYTAAEEGANFFTHVVKECTANPRSLIIHEVMGRNCGWLTAFTAITYHKMLADKEKAGEFLPEFGMAREREDVHAVYLPESRVNFDAEGRRLRALMDKYGCVNVFVSEGACVKQIIKILKKKGEKIPLDAFGHPRLDKVNVGQFFATQLAERVGAEKTQVFKSGYYARASAPCARDLRLIKEFCAKAVECALAGIGGVIGKDENKRNKLRACEFERIKGGKPFCVRNSRFRKLLMEIDQPPARKIRSNCKK